MRPMAQIRADIEKIPEPSRHNWCNAAGGCACAGCANHCGVTFEEWAMWLVADALWWKKRQYVKHWHTDPNGDWLTISQRRRGDQAQIALVRWREAKRPVLVLMFDEEHTEAMLVYRFFDEILEAE